MNYFPIISNCPNAHNVENFENVCCGCCKLFQKKFVGDWLRFTLLYNWICTT